MKNTLKLFLGGISLIGPLASASSILQFLPSTSNIPTMISAESATTYTLVQANAYCDGLNTANAGAGTACAVQKGNIVCGATNYTGWRIPAFEEIELFIGYSGATANYIWTRSPSYAQINGNYHVTYQLSTGSWNPNYLPTNLLNVRCVR